MFYSSRPVDSARASADRPRRRMLAAFAALVVLGLLAACGREEAAEAAAAEAAAAEPGALTIYTYDAFPQSLETLIATHFEEAYGVTPTLERHQDTGGLYNQLWLERAAPRADAAIGLDNTYIGRALDADLFQAYRPREADAIRDHLVIDPEFRLTPFDWGHVLLNYDSERLPDPPTTWEELLDPRLSESIILMNPATSSPGRNFLLLTIAVHGEDGYLDYWRRLSPNILTITSGWSEGYGLYSQGEAPIVLSYESSPPYHIAFEDTDRYRNLILDDHGYAQIEVAGVLSGATNVENARRLIDFLLSVEFQREIPLNQFMYPVRADVELPEAFNLVDTAGTSIFLPVERVDENFDRWLSDWLEVMQ